MSDFVIEDAKREQRWHRVMLVGASGAGKTRSANRLAAGMATVMRAKPVVICTQNRAATWEAEKFDFSLLDLRPPFSGTRFLQAIQAANKSSTVIVVDTLSSEHEDDGGLHDAHTDALERLIKDTARRRNVDPDSIDPKTLDGSAWNEAKKPRKELIRGMRFVNAHIIFTVRAKERSKIFAPKARPGQPKGAVEDGWVAITDDDFLFECPLRMLLLPMSNGVPTWNPVVDSERKAIRRPDHFDPLLARFEGKSLCEEMGAEMARWAMGDEAPKPAEQPKKSKADVGRERHEQMVKDIDGATSHSWLDKLAEMTNEWHAQKLWSDKTRDGIFAAIEAKRMTLSEGA